jgi:hypothetical protein
MYCRAQDELMSTRAPTASSERFGRTGVPLRTVRGGDERGGFEVSVDKADRVLHTRLWGVWSVSLTTEFCSAVRTFGRGFGGKAWSIIADSRHFSAQSPEVSKLRQETMVDLHRLGCDKIAAVVSTAVYSMQFKRITEQSHVGGSVFADEESALKWIREADARTR